ncbi:hypothetical protein BOX15_Mlig029859g2 [Macrostomum lignano]|uniref:HAT C-terminal dimerisation domain-containing protein n=1 Tax=Macrostomum lignano TaxID=282301 RepID=A0A267GSC2_9PLAT|nr:hypothetical protein BOX15_Mlig033566g4 [Macrostomum lignano]PAA88334.1 hypothetical protein BOX15_Mlig029859g2 [Macrostomum lignano]
MSLSKPRATAFRHEWLQRSIDGRVLSEWLQPDRSDELLGFCTVCKKSFHLGTSGFGAVTAHAQGKKHKSRLPVMNETGIAHFFPTQGSKPSFTAMKKADAEVLMAELRLGIHFIEHNIAYNTADHSGVYPAMFHDSKIAQDMKCHRTKLCYLVNHALAPVMRDEMIQDLNSGCGLFSLSIDESSDGARKHMAVVISFVSSKKGRLCTTALKTVEVSDCSAAALKEEVLKILDEFNIPIRNCVSISTDGPAVMVGKFNGFQKIMHDFASHLVSIGPCSLHIVSNAVRRACEAFDGNVEDFADEVFSYFQTSKRWTRYNKVQSLLQVAQHRMLRRVETRWVQLLPVVNRLIEQYDSLEEFFVKNPSLIEQKTKKTKEIAEHLKSTHTLLNLQFLAAVLPHLDQFEKAFQTEEPCVHLLHGEVRNLFRQTLSFFLNPAHIQENNRHLRNLSLEGKYFLSNEAIFIGEAAKETLKKGLSDTQQKLFFLRVRTFYRELALYLQEHLPLSNPVLRSLQFLDPQYPMKVGLAAATTSLAACNLAKQMEYTPDSVSKIDSEWRCFLVDQQVVALAKDNDVVTFWLRVSALELGGQKKYGTLTRLALGALTIQPGNAAVERVFSELSDLLTKKRNKLGELSIDACLFVRHYIRQSGLVGEEPTTCENFPLTDVYVQSAGKARSVYMEFLQQQRDADKAKKDARIAAKQLEEQLAAEIEVNKKKMELEAAEKKLAAEREIIEAEKRAASAMLLEYQKKMRTLEEREAKALHDDAKLLKRKLKTQDELAAEALKKAAKMICK